MNCFDLLPFSEHFYPLADFLLFLGFLLTNKNGIGLVHESSNLDMGMRVTRNEMG